MTTATAQPEAQPAQTVEVPSNPKPVTLDGSAHIAAAEKLERYSDIGPLYGGLNVVGDLGFEVGFQTGEGAELQRSGIGLYFRSDHMAKRNLHDKPEAQALLDAMVAALNA